jgi:hypothetical protein
MIDAYVAFTDYPGTRDTVLENLDVRLGKTTSGSIFSGIDFTHQAIMDTINAHFPGLPLIGGTTFGEITGVKGS